MLSIPRVIKIWSTLQKIIWTVLSVISSNASATLCVCMCSTLYVAFASMASLLLDFEFLESRHPGFVSLFSTILGTSYEQSETSIELY